MRGRFQCGENNIRKGLPQRGRSGGTSCIRRKAEASVGWALTTEDGRTGLAKRSKQHEVGVSSLRRGLDILRAFRAVDAPLSNKEISGSAGLPQATGGR